MPAARQAGRGRRRQERGAFTPALATLGLLGPPSQVPTQAEIPFSSPGCCPEFCIHDFVLFFLNKSPEGIKACKSRSTLALPVSLPEQTGSKGQAAPHGAEKPPARLPGATGARQGWGEEGFPCLR